MSLVAGGGRIAPARRGRAGCRAGGPGVPRTTGKSVAVPGEPVAPGAAGAEPRPSTCAGRAFPGPARKRTSAAVTVPAIPDDKAPAPPVVPPTTVPVVPAVPAPPAPGHVPATPAVPAPPEPAHVPATPAPPAPEACPHGHDNPGSEPSGPRRSGGRPCGGGDPGTDQARTPSPP